MVPNRLKNGWEKFIRGNGSLWLIPFFSTMPRSGGKACIDIEKGGRERKKERKSGFLDVYPRVSLDQK